MAPDDDQITDAILSGSAYERLRLQRETYFSQSIPTKLTWQSLLLAGLALLLPLWALYPATVAEYVPATDPSLASPKVLLLGLIGAGVELFTAALLVGAALYRIHRYPLTEDQARTVLNVEDFASYLGFGTGGLAIGITVLYFLIGAAGGSAIESYVQKMSSNPFEASGVGLSVAELATFAFVGCVVLMTLRLYLRYRLLALKTDVADTAESA
jgi:hypothetical protein